MGKRRETRQKGRDITVDCVLGLQVSGSPNREVPLNPHENVDIEAGEIGAPGHSTLLVAGAQHFAGGRKAKTAGTGASREDALTGKTQGQHLGASGTRVPSQPLMKLTGVQPLPDYRQEKPTGAGGNRDSISTRSRKGRNWGAEDCAGDSPIQYTDAGTEGTNDKGTDNHKGGEDSSTSDEGTDTTEEESDGIEHKGGDESSTSDEGTDTTEEETDGIEGSDSEEDPEFEELAPQLFDKMSDPLYSDIPADNTKPLYASLFRNNGERKQGLQLYFIEVDDEVIMEEEDLIGIEQEWGYCLVGCFTGRFPGMKALEGLTDKWAVTCKILPHHQGWFIFQFATEEDRTVVLTGGPYVLYSKTLLLKRLSPCFTFNYQDFMEVPIWLQFPNVPLELWNERALSKLGSRIGRPLCTDKITSQKSRISYARLLVEVDVSKQPLTSFEVQLPGGVCYTQMVRYETFPSYCCYCKNFGYNPFECKSRARNNKKAPKDTTTVECPKDTPHADNIVTGEGTVTRGSMGQLHLGAEAAVQDHTKVHAGSMTEVHSDNVGGYPTHTEGSTAVAVTKENLNGGGGKQALQTRMDPQTASDGEWKQVQTHRTNNKGKSNRTLTDRGKLSGFGTSASVKSYIAGTRGVGASTDPGKRSGRERPSTTK